MDEEFDVIIIGAGLSGINSAHLLQTHVPGTRYVILEARDVIGGTWAFFKYPGARSDSSSGAFRFDWHPWPHDTSFPDAKLFQAYVADAAHTQGIDEHIRFRHSVHTRSWSSAEQLWTVEVTDTRAAAAPLVDFGAAAAPDESALPAGARRRRLRARWLVNCSGYYSYTQAYEATIPGLDRFAGEVRHPQFWTDEVACSGKNVVILGSGATAVTMLPHVAARARRTTMLQRSPSYVLALPRKNHSAAVLQRWLPRRVADWADWWLQLVVEHAFVYFMLYFPAAGRRMLRRQAAALLPPRVDVDVHFNPAYSPFEQRLCMSPDGDFFAALRRDDCDIVTATIDSVTPDGIDVTRPDGTAAHIPADMIITATGLHVELLNGSLPVVDGVPVPLTDRFVWRGCMLEGVPNFAFVMGYTTGTWTPGADVHFRTVLQVMRLMRRRRAAVATPVIPGGPDARARMPRAPVLPNSSGYLVRARDRLPLSAGRYPWMLGLTYVYDLWCNLTGSARTGMQFTPPNKKTV